MSKHDSKQIGAWPLRTGVSFRVWAPFAETVSVVGSFSNWQEVPMESEDDGYWHTFVKGAVPGQEYKFSIKNGGNTYLRNDPRARHFTTNSGNSVIAGTEFDWGATTFTPPPIEKQVIYELHVGTFNRPEPSTGGTFQGIREKLDYLADLGINMIEIMPISSMLMDRGWGYATDYIYAVETLYGGRYEFLKLVKAAHEKGIGIILDIVYNHFGPDEKLDLWQFDGWQQDNKGGIYFYNDWRAETPWGNTRPDYGREEVRQYLLDNIRMWMHDCRVDGLRVDSTIFIRNVKGQNNDPSNDLPEGWKLLQDINTLAKKINPAAVTIGEDVADNEYIVKPVKDGGAGFSQQWELGFPHSLREALHTSDAAGINLTAICTELMRTYNGDAFSRVVFSDSHDSAANGSARLNELLEPGKADGLFARKQSLIAAALLLTSPGTPMLFQGQEFMEAGSFNDWRGLDWSRLGRNSGIYEAYKHLIALRRNLNGISGGLNGHGIVLTHVDEDNKVLAFHRYGVGGPKDDVMVIVNFADRQHDNYGLGFPRNGTWKVRFNSTWKGYGQDFTDVQVPDVLVETGDGSVVLPPSSAIILSQDN